MLVGDLKNDLKVEGWTSLSLRLIDARANFNKIGLVGNFDKILQISRKIWYVIGVHFESS